LFGASPVSSEDGTILELGFGRGFQWWNLFI